MSKEILQFINKLSNWRDNFEVVKYENENNTSIYSLVRSIRNRQIDFLLEKTEEIYSKDYFMLPHPEDESILTKAFASTHLGHCNFIFMTDIAKKNPWLLVQSGNFLDSFFTASGKLFHVSGEGSWLPAVANLNGLLNKHNLINDLEKCSYEPKKIDGLIISSDRPFHFFYDQLFSLQYLLHKKINKNVYYDEVFWPIENFDKNAKKTNRKISGVFVAPKTIGKGVYFENKRLVNKIMMPFETICRENLPSAAIDHSDLKIVINISSEKRAWLQQSIGYVSIIKELSKFFSTIKIYCDGMTAAINEEINISDNEDVFKFLNKNLSSYDSIKIEPIYGKEYPEKSSYYQVTDLVITPMGSSAILPIRIVRKNTIQFSNLDMIETVCKADGEFIVLNANKSHIIQEKSKVGDQPQHASYHIPWQHIFNLTAEVLNQIKGTKIEYLEVPPVEEVKETYDKENQKQALLALPERLKIEVESPDILREVAFAFEVNGDLQTAMKIMEKAHELRPHGPVIKRKLDEYRQLLSQNK